MIGRVVSFARIMTSRKKLSALRKIIEQCAELDLPIAPDIGIGSVATFPCSNRRLEYSEPIFSREVNLDSHLTRYIELSADTLDILPVLLPLATYVGA